VRRVILFIHGFGSCGWGEKSLALRRHLGLRRVLAPDLPFHPEAAMAHLAELCRRYPVSGLVGSSLGGFYATSLNAHNPLPTVLINPAIAPHRLLAGHLGEQRRWCDGTPFRVGRDWLTALEAMHRPAPGADEAYLVLLQTGDEVLDYRAAEAYYSGKDLRVTPGGSHRFDDFAAQLPVIRDWLAGHAALHH
jgi:predicted esterase YcpF (UPF0227 family)